MSRPHDDHKDYERRVWVEKYVHEADEELPPLTMEQYRYTLARARSAEQELAGLRSRLKEFKAVLNAS